MHFPFITYCMMLYKRQYIYRQNINIEKMYVYMRASFFHILKLLFPSIFLLVFHILCIQKHNFNFRCQITSAYIYNQCSFPLLLMVWCSIQTIVYRQTLTLRKCMFVRASGASELRKSPLVFAFLN